MATTTDFLPLVLIPRCPEALILQSIRKAVRRFCRESEIWTQDSIKITSLTSQTDYLLTVPYADTLISRVREVSIDGQKLSSFEWDFSFEDSQLNLFTEPPAGVVIEVEAAYMPDIIFTDVQDWLFNRWGYTIAMAAHSELKSMPSTEGDKVPWFDTVGAQESEAKYRAGLEEAKVEVYNQVRRINQ